MTEERHEPQYNIPRFKWVTLTTLARLCWWTSPENRWGYSWPDFCYIHIQWKRYELNFHLPPVCTLLISLTSYDFPKFHGYNTYNSWSSVKLWNASSSMSFSWELKILLRKKEMINFLFSILAYVSVNKMSPI